MTATRFNEEVRKLIGVPFLAQGRTLNGLDCAGIIVHAYRQIGIAIPERNDYSLRGENYTNDLLRLIAQSHDKIKSIDEAQDGDVLLFSTKYAGQAKHIGVLTSKSKMLFMHTTEQMKEAKEEALDDLKWLRHLHSIWRLKHG